MFKEKTFVFFWLCFCHLVGVFADELKSVSVMEGDSVTLQINVIEIQTGDEITWTFGTNRNLIAQINGATSNISIYDGPDGIFRGRLKLDKKTGSLTITNTRTKHSGVYEVEIGSSRSVSKHRFNVTVYSVFGDELKSVSVMEGDSVTLQINVTEIQTDDEITWTFGTNRNLLAETNGATSNISIYVGPDGIFRDRLKLDKKTGSLTITNTRTEHSGVYEAEISLSKSSPKYRFTVTVYAAATTKPPSTSHPTSYSPSGPTSHVSDSPSGSLGSNLLVVQISAAAAGFLLIVASVGIFYICRKQRKTHQHVEAREEEITYADPKFYKRNKPTVKQEDEVVYAAVVSRR